MTKTMTMEIKRLIDSTLTSVELMAQIEGVGQYDQENQAVITLDEMKSVMRLLATQISQIDNEFRRLAKAIDIDITKKMEEMTDEELDDFLLRDNFS
jgi:hypothetical protein